MLVARALQDVNLSADRRRAVQYHYAAAECGNMTIEEHAGVLDEDGAYAGCRKLDSKSGISQAMLRRYPAALLSQLGRSRNAPSSVPTCSARAPTWRAQAMALAESSITSASFGAMPLSANSRS